MTTNSFKFSILVFSVLVTGTIRAQGVNLAPIPLKVDNGAAVAVKAVFSPPMRAGERAVFSVNGTEVLQAAPRQGEMAELGLRVVLPRAQNEVQVSRYVGANPSEEHMRRVEATLPGPLGAASALSVADARTRFSPEGDGGTFRILLTGENGYAGVLSVNDSNFGLDLTSRGGLSSNPFFMIKGSLTQGASLSAQSLAPSAPAAPARGADDPKGRGRSARVT
jgi:hypothetical protein